MSQGKVEKLRAAYEAFNRGDFDAAVQLARPDAEFVRPGLEPTLRGAAAIRE
jgi:ketosteroid isomerase-like protein